MSAKCIVLEKPLEEIIAEAVVEERERCARIVRSHQDIWHPRDESMNTMLQRVEDKIRGTRP